MEMDEVQLEVLNLDGLAMKNHATEQITNISVTYYNDRLHSTIKVAAYKAIMDANDKKLMGKIKKKKPKKKTKSKDSNYDSSWW